jgi:nucleoside-diphosphate-sugar epimerase
MNKLAAITGGAGFIGSHLAEGFVKNGYAVRIIDNLTAAETTNLAGVSGEVDYRKVDILDLDGLTEAFNDASVVLHHAGISSVPCCFVDLNYTHEVNVTGTLNVFTAASRAGVRKVINASSASVYGNDDAKIQTEDAIPSPVSPYGLSKWMGELYAAQFSRITSLETISLRYFNVYGPRQDLASRHPAVIPLFIRKLANGDPPVIFGDGTQTRDFSFIDNIVEANLRAAQISVPPGAILNIASGTQISLNELVNLLNEIFGLQKAPIYELERLGDVKHSRANICLSKDLLGDYNVTGLHAGLLKTALWFLKISGLGKKCEERQSCTSILAHSPIISRDQAPERLPR